MIWLGPIFNGIAVAVLISPAFVPEMALWNLLGFVSLVPGIFFTNKSLT